MARHGHECTNNEWNHNEEGWAEYDGRGIYLCRVCEKCEKEKLGRYRPEIFGHYTENDVDEPIDPEDYYDREYDF